MLTVALFGSGWVLAGTRSATAPSQAAKPLFHTERGFFNTPFALAITAPTPGASIYFSTDCSEPAPTNSVRYTQPFMVTNTVVVRARAWKEGMLPSDTVTHSFLFLDDVPRQSPDGQPPPHFPASWGANAVNYGMDPNVVSRYTRAEWREALTQVPSISVVTEMRNLFDPTIGIYANAWQRGQAWERPASIEMLDSTATPAGRFQENCGLRIRGGYSRNPQYAKHSFRVFFRSEYGAGKLRYPLFESDGADEFDTFDLRTSQNYSWAIDPNAGQYDTMLQDVFCRETLGALGQPTTRSRYYHLYLNGQYWGLYESQERPEEAYGESYFGGDKEDYDVVKSANHPGVFVTEASDGNLDALRMLWTMARAVAANPANSNYFALLGRDADGVRNPSRPVLLEVDNLIDYMLVIFYSGDGDAPLSYFLNYERSNNWFGLRNRNNPAKGFVFFNHDAEHTLGAPFSQFDRTGPYVRANQNDFTYANPQWIHEDLAANAEYRLRFADHVQRHFFNGGALTPEAGTNRFLRKAAQIDKAIRASAARWGDTVREPPYGEAEWRTTIGQIVGNWFPSRTAYVLDQLRKARLFPMIAAPEIQFTPPAGREASNPSGPFTLALAHVNAAGAVYFTVDGTDPREVGGAIAPGARLYIGLVSVPAGVQVRARVQNGSDWSALSEDRGPAGLSVSGKEDLTIRRINHGVALGFIGAAQRSYALEFREDVSSGAWQTLTNFLPNSIEKSFEIPDALGGPRRFYRLRIME